MRQKVATADDLKLRTALENMRYRACTEEDIKFLRTKVASDRPGHPHLDSIKFRNVSVITAWNIHKDTINDLGARRFAEDTGQQLHKFYSIDRLSMKAADAKRFKYCEPARRKAISLKLQEQLWAATPSSTSEHVPGCLRLCIGMPVILKSNDATELCITKGQEGIVRGWTEMKGPHGKRILETLFVELTNPPKSVQIPDLPLNVVPLARTSSRITTLLEDDTLLSINRDQVLVLQNFAMTDYGAQGKSRIENVCHLNNCKNHMGYHVCLSRGTSADGTAIISGFDEKVIIGGLPGHIRQEFRELKMLDEITRLRETNQLPPYVTGIYRGQLLTSFKKWRKNTPDPDHFHPAILFQTEYDVWRPNKIEETTHKKRKADTDTQTQPKKKCKKMETRAQNTEQQSTTDKPSSGHHTERQVDTTSIETMPLGLIWDSINWSCGYDALLMPLGHLWHKDKLRWSAIFQELHPLLCLWSMEMHLEPNSPEIARNEVRKRLTGAAPDKFPPGPVGILIDNLLEAVSSTKTYGSAVLFCENCGHRAEGIIETLNMLLATYHPMGWDTLYPGEYRLSQWLMHHLDRKVGSRCPRCSQKMRRRTTQLELPPLLLVDINSNRILLDETLTFNIGPISKTTYLSGLIYYSAPGKHFTSIIISDNGTMWYHDGITTRRGCHNIGNLSAVNKKMLHRVNDSYVLWVAIYATCE
ncbi:hypothetical protein B0H16DRAFT_1345312 [Mycena metata]|uniref:Uncharacterized protein n=1 Tax=Mycena metata TaxID=1033252 RepID=A0AAD7MA03_9AGAR|nr:hypothetical protein B0H16DRAFT_1345312 [Mycena metata]